MTPNQTLKNLTWASLLLTQILFSSCSVLIGNVKPSIEKSGSYSVKEMTEIDSDWVKRDPTPQSTEKTEVLDMTYQSKSTYATVSLNSVCHKNVASEGSTNESSPSKAEELNSVATQLMLGFSEIDSKETKNVQVAQEPALETTIRGKYDTENVMVRTVVVKRAACVYDFMYVARPDTFAAKETAFQQFVSSFSWN